MKIKTIELPEEYKCCYLVPISDTHIGDPSFNEQKLMKYIQWVKDTPNARVVLVGDIMNTATKDSVSDSYSEKMDPNQQLKYATALLEPIRSQIIGCCSGNHERRIAKSTSIDTSELLAQNLGCFYDMNALMLKVTLGKAANGKRVAYTIYATHGWGGGKKIGGKANNLQSMSTSILADVYIMAHIHQMQTFQDVYLMPDTRNNNIVEVKRTYVSGGAYLDYGGYGQLMGFSPSKIGSPRIRLDGMKKDCHVSI